MPCFGCTSAGADLALQMGFCRAQMGRSRLWQQQAGEGLWRGGLCSIWAVCSSWSTAMGNGSAGHPVLKPGTVITPCQAPAEPFPSLSRAMRGSLGRILRKQAVPQQRGESSGDLLWSSRTRWKGDSRIPQGWEEPLEMLQCNSPAKGARLFPAKLVLCSVVLFLWLLGSSNLLLEFNQAFRSP